MRLQYLRNKKTFSNGGVIFDVQERSGKNAICMSHWPHCGMDAKVARRFAEWLMKRADDIDDKRNIQRGSKKRSR